MTIKKTLTSIVLAGALALGSAGCSKGYSQYKYNGKIGEDQVTFTIKNNSFFTDYNILTVTKPDGRVIKYVDCWREDLKLDYIEITKNGQTTKYIHNDEIGKPILEEAQKQFDAYMQKIEETKQKIEETRINQGINQGLENLK